MMKKLIVLSIILLFLVGCTTLPLTIEQRVKVFGREYFTVCPVFEAMFEEVEVIAFICDDGQTITFSSYEKHSINFGLKKTSVNEYIEKIKSALAVIDKDLTQVDLVIHNHFKVRKFSNSDKAFYFELRRNGFKGAFAVYYVPTRDVVAINDNETF